MVERKLMALYWMLFFIPAFFALVGNRRVKKESGLYAINIDFLWLILIFILTIFIGFRVEVGGDWFAYLTMYALMSNFENFFDAESALLLAGDPGYLYINWFSAQFDWGIYGTNIICGFIFSVGLSLFCRTLPRPLLALTVAIPYMVIVVAMGYSRQAAALGIILLGFIALIKDKKIQFMFWVLVAVTLHKSAIIIAPIAALAVSKNRLQNIFFLGLLFAILYFNFLADPFEKLYQNYILSQDAQSQGALIRVLMSAVPSLIYLIWPHRFNFHRNERGLWGLISFISIALLFLLFIFPDLSTAIDRVALYMLPIQLVIFSYLPDIFQQKNAISKIIVFLIIFYYTCVLFVWLNFAIHSAGWLPYRNLLIDLQ
tara:strand:+ start:1228 stop:2343 length:1116 start_codon:yes stop_codon:yes gene_type:complete